MAFVLEIRNEDDEPKLGYDWKKSRMLQGAFDSKKKPPANYGPGKGGSSDPRPLPYDAKDMSDDTIRRNTLSKRLSKLDKDQEENKPRKKVGY